MTPDELRERALNAIGGENEPVVLALLRLGDLLSDMLREMYEMVTDPEDGRPLDGYVLVTGEPAVIEAKPRKGGAEDIATERARQWAKGYNDDHDSKHGVHEFVAQATHLLGQRTLPKSSAWCRRESDGVPTRRDLVRAGALIAAAIDRLDAEESR